MIPEPASEALAVTAIVPVTSEPAVGLVMFTVGGVVSLIGVATTYADMMSTLELLSYTCRRSQYVPGEL